MHLSVIINLNENLYLIVPFSSQVSPSNPSTHSHENLPFPLWQDAPFLQGELSHGLTEEKKENQYFSNSITIIFHKKHWIKCI